jgi:hypothetical protein
MSNNLAVMTLETVSPPHLQRKVFQREAKGLVEPDDEINAGRKPGWIPQKKWPPGKERPY